MASFIMERGGTPLHLPLTLQVPVSNESPKCKMDLVLISSAKTVKYSPDLSHFLSNSKVVAIGEKTALSLKEARVGVDAIGTGGGKNAVEMVQTLFQPNDKVFHIGAQVMSTSLRMAFSKWDIPLHRWVVYRTIDNPQAKIIFSGLPGIDVACFSSGSAVRAWKRIDGRARKIVAIGPDTESVAKKIGVKVDKVAEERNFKSLVAAAFTL